MAISGTDYVLVDSRNGILLGADTTVIVPEAFGAAGYDVAYDADSAIEYGEQQGIALDMPGSPGIPVQDLDEEPRGYLAIDTDTGYVADPADLRVVPLEDDMEDLTPDDALELAKSGQEPVVSDAVRDVEGLPFESVLS